MKITAIQLLLSPLPLFCWLIACDKSVTEYESASYFWLGSLLALIFPLFPNQSLIATCLVLIWYLAEPMRERRSFYCFAINSGKNFHRHSLISQPLSGQDPQYPPRYNMSRNDQLESSGRNSSSGQRSLICQGHRFRQLNAPQKTGIFSL